MSRGATGKSVSASTASTFTEEVVDFDTDLDPMDAKLNEIRALRV